MIPERVTLVLAGTIFVTIGFMFYYDPAYAALVGIELPGAAARADIRTVYGGLDMAIGLFAFWAAWRRQTLYPGLVLMTLAFGCLVAGRCLAFVFDRPGPGIIVTLTVAETVGLVWCAAVLYGHMRRASLESHRQAG